MGIYFVIYQVYLLCMIAYDSVFFHVSRGLGMDTSVCYFVASRVGNSTPIVVVFTCPGPIKWWQQLRAGEILLEEKCLKPMHFALGRIYLVPMVYTGGITKCARVHAYLSVSGVDSCYPMSRFSLALRAAPRSKTRTEHPT